MDYEDIDTEYEDIDNEDTDITSCPTNVNDPELQDTDTWKSYDNSLGSNLFHCGYEGYLENVEPTPERPQQECFYDNDRNGDLVNEQHENAGCRGTANQYDGHGDFMDAIRHTFIDDGGIWEHGREGVATSIEHHWDNLWNDETGEVSESNPESANDPDTHFDSGSVFDSW